MTGSPNRAALLAAMVSMALGCASTSPNPAFKDVANRVETQSGHRVQWDPESTKNGPLNRAVDDLLARELTVDGAVQVALLSNLRLRSTYEELSIAQADLVQAGLLKNPVFSLGRTAWEAEHISPNLFASVEQDFLDVLTLPMRKRIAATELEATKLQVGDEILKLASEVRSAFYRAQAAEQVAAMRRLVKEAAETSAELAKRQADAGNINDLALSSERALASRTRLDSKRSEGEATVEREHLNKVMGVWGSRTAWKTSVRLPELPAEEVPLAHLESIAIRKRLDIEAARRQLQAIDYTLSLAKTTRWTGTISVNVEAGRLRGTNHISFGPSVSLEIPLFDQRQAAIARLEAFQRQADNNLRALSVDARSDVRAAQARVMTARSVVEEYGKTLVPLRETIVALSQQQYDAMLLGVYQLLQAKQNEFEVYGEYIEALRDYWIARNDLERAVGQRLGPESTAPMRESLSDAVKDGSTPPPLSPPKQPESHHH